MLKFVRNMTIAASVLVLSACALQPVTPQTPEQTVFAATATYATLLSVATAYESLPRCSTVEDNLPCSDADVVAKLRVADNATYATLQSAQNVVRDQSGLFDAATKEIVAGGLDKVISEYSNLAVEFGLLSSEDLNTDTQ